MSKIESYFARHQVGGDIEWPADSEERDKLASDLLGAEIVSSLDYWVDRAVDYLRNPESSTEFPRKNQAWLHEVRTRSELAGLTTSQQDAVIRLVAETVSGAVFSALVAFDQCAGAEIRIDAHDLETEEKVATILPGYIDFHDRLYEWINLFSDHPDRYDPNAPVG